MTSSISSFLQSLRIVKLEPKDPGTRKTFLRPKAKDELLAEELPEITLDTVAQHDDYEDCWIVIYDRVYDVTKFLHSHPGGADIIMDHAGRDATLAFHGTGHSQDAIEMMRSYLIGELPSQQRIFRKTNVKVLLSGIPD